MKKLFLYASLACIGLVSCSKDFFVSEEELPEWLGESIYEELKNPKTLDGTFNTYLRLIDDLGYAEVLSKTGSKTIFPANDVAFEAFFKDGNNRFGKSSYEELTAAEKAQLLYSSMLDNAILVKTLSNDDEAVIQGRFIKHNTNLSLVHSVTPLFSQNMPSNNRYFNNWKNQGKSINALYDNTEAPMVHFTYEYMMNKNMTVSGADNDFYILTGNEYNDGDVYVFNRKVKQGNVTCQNGYIHQLDSVMLNPGNMAQILREGKNTHYISRMLDYYCAPFKVNNELQASYFEYAAANNYGTQDSVFAIRYFSKNSQRALLNQYTTGAPIANGRLLDFDPGWNNYNPTTGVSSTKDGEEIAAFFVPTDDVVENYFLHDGAYIVENLGAKDVPNDKEHLNDHLDAIYNTDPTVFAGIINNIMKPRLTDAVPSKFSTVQNDAFEFMNVTKENIRRKADGKYDVTVANNGVLYYMNKFFAPELYNSVLGPASVYTDMHIMGEMLNDHQITPGQGSTLGADMYYYLLSMKSKYALFIPQDGDEFYYVDPTTVDDEDGMKALRFYYDPTATGTFHIMVQRYFYNPETNTYRMDPTVGPVNVEKGYYNTQIQDMLNYHTVVLENSDGLNGQRYYKTKHGGVIYVPDGTGSHDDQSTVHGALQIGDNAMPGATVLERFYANSPKANITNGTVYKLDRPIQPAINKVYSVLASVPEFADFFQFCENFNNEDLLYYAGILSNTDTDAQKASKMAAYTIFGEGDLVNMFGSYNYTLYVPTNMQTAYDNGLEKWETLQAIYDNGWENSGFSSEEQAQKYVREKIEAMRSFVLYHMQNSSVYADNVVNTASYQTMCSDQLGVAKTISVSGGNGNITLTDASGNSANVTHKNLFARDVKSELHGDGRDMNNQSFTYNVIRSSAFVTIHGIDKPLCYNTDYNFEK